MAAEIKLLGRATDRDVARRLGLHEQTVAKMRHSLRIPRASRRRNRRSG